MTQTPPQDRPPRSRHAPRLSWLRVLLGLGILAVLAWRLGTGVFLDGVQAIDGAAVLMALGIGLLTTVFSAWRWCLVARRLGLPLPLTTAVADYYRSLFLNTALPGGVLGDVHRALRHGRSAGDTGRGVRAVILERTAGQVVLFAVAATVLLGKPSTVSAETRHIVVIFGIAAVLCVLGVTTALTTRGKRVRSRSRWHRALATTLTDVRHGLLARDTWPGVAILSVLALAGHLALFLVAARTAGLSAPVAQLAPLMVLALLAMGLPVNVGGWGPREGVSALAFGAAGLGAAQGVTVAVVYGLLTFVACLPGVAVLILRDAARSQAGGSQVEFEERVLSEGKTARRRA